MKQGNAQQWAGSILIILFLFASACQKDHKKPETQTIELGNAAPGQRSFTIISDNVSETDEGLRFTGELNTKNEDGESFKVGEGDFEVITAADGSVTGISGQAIAHFPTIGLFGKMLKTFTWKFIKGHIEYAPGSYFIQKYNTDLPLNPGIFYLHYEVFDESKDGKFELRNTLNNILYSFYDMYIDPLDPSLFFKVTLEKPVKAKETSPDNVVTKFWEKVFENAAHYGGQGINYATGKQMLAGISNKGYILSSPYEFRVVDPETFRDKYGFNQFESLPSHYYFELAGVPIPRTGILEVDGKVYVHSPVKTLIPEVDKDRTLSENHDAVLSWLNNEETNGFMVNMTGAVDPTGKGISQVLSALPMANQLFDSELFNKDINLDIIGSTLQFQIPGKDQLPSGAVPSFLRLGLEMRGPILADVFGKDILKYFTFASGENTKYYFYLSVGPTLDDISIYTESLTRVHVPFTGYIDLGRVTYFITLDTVEVSGSQEINMKGLLLDQGITGFLSKEGYLLTAPVKNSLKLPGEGGLTILHMDMQIDHISGATLEGEVQLPYGLGNATVTGSHRNDTLKLSGRLQTGASILLDNGLQLPAGGISFTYIYSDNQLVDLEMEGELLVPHVGNVTVTGKATGGNYLFEGYASASEMTFGSVTLQQSNSFVRISGSQGIEYNATFNLDAFGQRKLSGTITPEQIRLSSTPFNSTVRIGGHDFSFANASVVADNSGVKINGRINLYKFNTQVSGNMTAPDNFRMTGNHNYDGAYVKSGINITVTPASVSLTGNGRIYGVLGNQLFSGALRFVPNWSTGEIRACYPSAVTEVCVKL